MSEDQNSALNRATDLINAGNFNEALEQSQTLLITDPTNGSAKLIEAIALSQLGNNRDASEAFSAAIQMSPTSVKPRFNAAVHEFNTGNVGQARLLANEALDLDPKHEGTKELIERMGPEQTLSSGAVSYPRESASEFEPAYAGLEFVRRLGAGWVAIGWLLAITSAACFLYGLAVMLPHSGDIMSAFRAGDQAKIQQIANSMQGPAIQILSWVLVLGNMVWTILDLIHRKGNFLWLIAHIPCTCCGFSFVTQPLYILFGRK